MILALDEPLTEEHIKQILSIPDVYTAKKIAMLGIDIPQKRVL